MGFPRQKHWSGLPFPSPGNLNYQGVEHGPPALAGRFLNTPQQIYVTATWPLPPNVYSSHKVAISFVQIKGEPHESRVPPWDSSPTEYSTAPQPKYVPLQDIRGRPLTLLLLREPLTDAMWCLLGFTCLSHNDAHHIALYVPEHPSTSSKNLLLILFSLSLNGLTFIKPKAQK